MNEEGKVRVGVDTGVTIEEAIKKSKNYAKRGEKLARDSIKLVKKAATEILEKLDFTIQEMNEKNVNGSNGLETLVGQLEEIRSELIVLPDKMLDDIKCISKKTINITLFGRTMAGKSTLMEILTHGKGDAIGKGYQRTTRDVREYSYKGLTITDVPGIAAFEGKTDEEIAYNSAKKADLIFFLITDDAPQASEADCLRKILDLGKPVVCLVNIKANIDEKTSTKMFTRDVEKKMTSERLEAIKKQFISFGASYGQTWEMLTFEFVHLKSAYLAQSTSWNRDNEELFRLSRFECVEKLIADEVTKNSGYYKIKAYIDTVVVPLMKTADMLIQQASENRSHSAIIEAKKEKLEKWLSKYKDNGKKQIEKSLNVLKNEIKKEIPGFAETHYSDKKADENWAQVLEKFHIEDRCGEIMNQRAKECDEKLQEIYREIASEIKFSTVNLSESTIHTSSVVDGKRIWDWGVTISTGVLSVLALFGVPVVGWVALGVGIVGGFASLLFKSKDKKIKEAREKLEKNINNSLNKQFKDIYTQMEKIFEDELIKKQVSPSVSFFGDIINIINSVSVVQVSFAQNLYNKQEEVNRVLLEEASLYLNITSLSTDVVRVTRIPGTCFSVCVNNVPSKKIQNNLASVLKETMLVIKYVDDLLELISRQTGVPKSQIKVDYDDKNNPVGVRVDLKDKVTPSTVNRIKMAQQLSKMYISK